MLTAYIPYIISSLDEKTAIYRDIFAFRNTFTTVSENPEATLRYQIKDGDTPRSLANLLYGSERYEWVFYCMNSIVNPYYDWPLSEDSFYEMIETKYLNKQCLFLEIDSFTNNFTVGETITQGNTSAVVDAWDRTLCKITIKDVDGTFEVSQQVVSNSSSGTVARIVELAEEALHHFETPTGAKLDPYAGFLQQYLDGTSDLYAIINKDYELQINDSKRNIYVVKPEFVRIMEANLSKNLNQIATFEAENTLR